MPILVFPITRVHLGLKVEGRKNLRKHRALLKKGMITCSNHVAQWDFPAVRRALYPFKPYVLVLEKNVSGEYGPLVRAVGGIPLPESDTRAIAVCSREVLKLLGEGGWLHVYPEGSLWEYYERIRPFKCGIGYFACRADKPVLPMAFSYRKPSRIREKLFHQPACYTISIGEPIIPDETLPLKEREIDMVRRCHAAVCRLAGLTPEENGYAPLFDRSRRIDA